MDARMNATQCYVKRRNATQYTELHDVMLFMTLIYMTCIVHKLSCCSVEMAHCIAGLSSRQKQCSKVIRALSETSNTITSDNAICCEMPMQNQGLNGLRQDMEVAPPRRAQTHSFRQDNRSSQAGALGACALQLQCHRTL